MTARIDICSTGIYYRPIKDAKGKIITPGRLEPWKDNPDLIARGCVPLHYLAGPDAPYLDPTYGLGVWWNAHCPDGLVHHDIKHDGVDFRRLPHPDRSMRGAAFDPPYVVPGGLESSTMPGFHDQYGMNALDDDGARLFSNPSELHAMNCAGLAEVARVVIPASKGAGGYILCKTANYVWSGHLVLGANDIVTFARSIGLRVIDHFILSGHPRAQPERTRKCSTCAGLGGFPPEDPEESPEECEDCDGSGRRTSPVVHARQNSSALYVLQVPPRWKPTALPTSEQLALA